MPFLHVAPPTLTQVSLCSGVAMLDLAVEAATGCRTVAYAERDGYAAATLLARMEESSLEPSPVWSGDLGACDWCRFRGLVDILTAGFPCQPHSVAGKGAGLEDERWIFPDILRAAGDMEPVAVFLENVPGLVHSGGLAACLAGLASLGFRVLDPRTDLVLWAAIYQHLSAAEVGASHERNRIFILAYRPCGRLRELWESSQRQRLAHWSGQTVADPGHNQWWRMRASEGNEHRDTDQTGRDEGTNPPATSGGELADSDSQGRQQIARSAPRDEEAHGGTGRHALQPDGNHLSSGDGADLAHPHLRARCAQSGFPPEDDLPLPGPASGATDSGALADSESERRGEARRDRCGECEERTSGSDTGLDAVPQPPGRRSKLRRKSGTHTVVADACHRQLPMPRRGSEGRTGTRPASEILGDTESLRERESHDETRPDSRGDSRGDSSGTDCGVVPLATSDLADATTSSEGGCSWSQPGGASRIDRKCGGESHAITPPVLFAPGPADPRWPHTLRTHQHLAPAIEPGLRLLADGMALVLDEARADQLRCAGNGVVALQAAVAFVVLLSRAVERMDA